MSAEVKTGSSAVRAHGAPPSRCSTNHDHIIQLQLQLDLYLADAKPSAPGPDLDPILNLHRADDGYVTFHVFRDGELKSDCSVRRGKLANLFPEFRDELQRDGYFSVNAFWAPGRGVGLAGQPKALRNSRSARYLNAAFVDIDAHDREFDFGEMVGKVISLADKNVIPTPSIFVRSGRGLWLMWLLVDKQDSELPPVAHSARLLLWNAVQDELGRRLADLGADRGALDVARITRVPNSINTKADRRVLYLFPSSDGNLGYTYTVEQLASFLGVQQPTLRSSANPSDRARCIRALTGHRALAEHRLNDFLRLRDMRGGFSEGSRNNAAVIFVHILRANGFDQATIDREVTKLAADCRPPLKPREVANVLKKKARRMMRDHLIACRLHVTPAEAALIPRWSQSDDTQPPVPRVQMFTHERRELICKLASARPYLPSCRQMVQMLRAHGVVVSHVTVSTDYRFLRLERTTPLLGEGT
jgi:hypothetical protein